MGSWGGAQTPKVSPARVHLLLLHVERRFLGHFWPDGDPDPGHIQGKSSDLIYDQVNYIQLHLMLVMSLVTVSKRQTHI